MSSVRVETVVDQLEPDEPVQVRRARMKRGESSRNAQGIVFFTCHEDLYRFLGLSKEQYEELHPADDAFDTSCEGFRAFLSEYSDRLHSLGLDEPRPLSIDDLWHVVESKIHQRMLFIVQHWRIFEDDHALRKDLEYVNALRNDFAWVFDNLSEADLYGPPIPITDVLKEKDDLGMFRKLGLSELSMVPAHAEAIMIHDGKCYGLYRFRFGPLCARLRTPFQPKITLLRKAESGWIKIQSGISELDELLD
jgi:hypothetical protein